LYVVAQTATGNTAARIVPHIILITPHSFLKFQSPRLKPAPSPRHQDTDITNASNQHPPHIFALFANIQQFSHLK
jgi:hypothetical protein